MKKAAKGRPRKRFGRQSEQVNFRVTESVKATLERAAVAAEMEFSDWLRMVVESAARKQLGEEGKGE